MMDIVKNATEAATRDKWTQWMLLATATISGIGLKLPDAMQSILKPLPPEAILPYRLSGLLTLLGIGTFAALLRQFFYVRSLRHLSEMKITALQSKNENLEARLEKATIDRDHTQEQYDRLTKEHEEETRIIRAIDFRRGKRTGNQWMPFCVKCHQPIISDSMSSVVQCISVLTCHAHLDVSPNDLASILGELNS